MTEDLEYHAGKLIHEFTSVCEAMIKFCIKNPEAIGSMFEMEIIPASLGLMNLIIAHQRWQLERSEKRDVNQRLCQVRH